MDASFVGAVFCLNMSDFLYRFGPRLFQKAADEILGVPRVGDVDERPAPKPPWLLMAGTHSVRAVATLAALSFLFSPVTSTSRLSRSSWLWPSSMQAMKSGM